MNDTLQELHDAWRNAKIWYKNKFLYEDMEKNENAQFYENKRKRGDIWLTRAAWRYTDNQFFSALL